MCWFIVDEWEVIGCYNNFDYFVFFVYFYILIDLDVNEFWLNLKLLVKVCSK